MRPSLLRITIVAALGALATSAAPAVGQSPREIHTGIAAGATLGQGRSDPGFALLGAADVGRVGSRVGLRGELLYTRASREVRGLLGVPCAECSALVPYSRAERTEQNLGALLGATYRLTDASRLRSYVLGGLGVYRTQTDFEGTVGSPCPPGSVCIATLVEPYTVHETEHRLGVGLHLGVGSAVRFGALELTAEARYHVLERGVGSRRMIPVTLGVRF